MRRKKGFTLVELLIVIIVIAVLAAIAVPKFARQSQLSREASLRQSLRIARLAVDRFNADTGHFPQRMSWLNDFENEVVPTFPALMPNGTEVQLPAIVYKGPYISDDSGNGMFTTQPNPKGGNFTHSAIKVPMDPISKLPFKCSLTGGRFIVTSSAAGNDSNGVPYANY